MHLHRWAVTVAALAAAAAAGALVAADAVTVTVADADADADAPTPRGRVLTVEHTPLTEAPTRGPIDAPVTVEVFFAAGSELGNQAYRRATALWRKHPGRVRLVFRPLRKGDGTSQYVSPIALAAHARGRFFAFMDQLVGGPGPQPSQAAALDLAARTGLDRSAAEAAIADPVIARALAANDRRAERARVSTRADLVVNGRGIGPTPDETTLEAAYRGALELARIERAAGAPPHAITPLAVRRARCLEVHERLGTFRDDGGTGTPDEADAARAPLTGLHLSTLLRDGTDCPPAPTPIGRVDQTFDFEVAERAPRGALLRAPLDTAGLPSCGPARAPVVVQVVCNLRYPSCTEQLERARKVAAAYVPDVRVVFRPWVDLDDDSATVSLPLAQAAMCSQRLGDGWRFVMRLRGADRDTFDAAATAEALDIDRAAFTACTDGPRDAARQAIVAARAAGVAWSPTVIIGQRAYVSGFTDPGPLEDVLDAELAPGLLGALDPPGRLDARAPATDDAAGDAVKSCDDAR